MRITYDPAADAVCIHLTGAPLPPGRTTIQASNPPGTQAFVALDWKDDRLVGLEIPGRQQPPAPRPARPSRNHQLTASQTPADPAHSNLQI